MKNQSTTQQLDQGAKFSPSIHSYIRLQQKFHTHMFCSHHDPEFSYHRQHLTPPCLFFACISHACDSQIDAEHYVELYQFHSNSCNLRKKCASLTTHFLIPLHRLSTSPSIFRYAYILGLNPINSVMILPPSSSFITPSLFLFTPICSNKNHRYWSM